MIHKPLFDVRYIKSLKDMIEQSSSLFGEKNAFLIKGKDGIYSGITYTTFKKDIDALGTAMLQLGLKGTNIAVIGENSYEWCVSYLATVNGTGVIVPIDRELPLHEVENILKRAHIRAVIHSGKHKQDMIEIAKRMPSIQYFINMHATENENSFLSFSQLIRTGEELIASGDRSYIDATINEEALSMLLFTSGTTDMAKGVMLSHKNISSNVMAVCASLHIDNSDSSLSILPLHHTYECTAGFLVMMYNGCAISFCEGLKHIAKNLNEVKPTILILVPLILEGMHKKIWAKASKKFGATEILKLFMIISNFLYRCFGIDIRKKLFKTIHESIGGRVRLIISGAAAIDPHVSKEFNAMGFSVIQGYGLTECSPIVAVGREKTAKDSAIGQPLPGLEVKIHNPNEEGIGEIIVKGDCVMLGYFENDYATDKVLKDGWLYTGDLGKADKTDSYTITGRIKNIIVTKNGKNIYPEEVEYCLSKSPYILESIVWGKYDEDTDETIVNAQIFPDYEAISAKLKTNHVSTAEAFKVIRAEVKTINRTLPLYKHVRDISIQETEFDKTTTKKIKRFAVKAES